MDIVPLVSTIASCAEPGSVDRHLLHQRLTELVLAVRNAKATNVDSTSLLTHITLVAARLVSHRVELSDRERELVLETVQEALTPKAHRPLFNVHAVVVDHIGRILVPLFVAPSALPDATRLLAINAWRQLVKVASVHVPEKHSTQKSRQLPCALSLCDYIKEFMPPDYLSLAVCALLDNAETADDQRLRVRALEALLDLFQKDGLVDRVSMSSMFPGTVSALTRIALAQLPANSQNAPKRPISAVRTQAFHALEAAILVMYRGSHTLDKADVAEEWAQQARGGSKSIVDVDATQANEPDRLQQILWRLASLRHNSGTLSALFSLFACVSSLECASRMPEGCVQVAVETCLAVAGQQPDLASSYLLDLKLRCSEGDSVGARVEAVLEPLLKQFERFVTNGEPRQRSDVLCVISACVRVLGQHRVLPLVSPWWRSQGLPALLTSLSISLPGTSLLISDTQEPLDDVSYVLENYRTTELSHALDQFVQSMADLFTPREMGAQLLSLLFDSSDRQVSVLWMLRKVAGQATLGDLSSICPSAFQYCVDFCGSAPDPDTDASQRAAHELMVLDVVSTLVPLIGPNVAYYMDTLLFPLLQTTMASSPALQAQAHRVLDILAQQTSSTVAHMLHDNVDYIVEGCSRQIRSVALHPHVFSILCGAVQLVGKDILVYMDDVVEDTLDVCERLAYEDDEIVTGALQFLEIVTRTVADEPKMIEESTKGRVEMLDPDPIASAIKAMDDAAASRMLEDLVLTDPIPELPTSIADPKPNKDADIEPEDASAPEGNPLAIKICLAIQSFLYTDSSAHQLLALKTVHNSTSALQTTRDLLPLLNEVWPSLVNRLNQRDAHYVTLAACDVIERVCVLGSSWMRKRVKDDLWPHFERILRNTPLQMQRSESVLARRILHTMSKVVEYVTLDEGMAWTVCVLVVRFFGSDVEPELIELLQKMVPVYGDKVWLVLAKLGRVDGVQPNAILDIGVSSNIKPPVGICQMLGL